MYNDFFKLSTNFYTAYHGLPRFFSLVGNYFLQAAPVSRESKNGRAVFLLSVRRTSFNIRHGRRVAHSQNRRVFLCNKNTVVSGAWMYRERPLLGFALLSPEAKNPCGVFLLSIRSRFLRTARNRSVSRKAKNGRAVFLLSTRAQILRTARICSCKSRVEKRLQRFSFIRDAHNSCALLGFG